MIHILIKYRIPSAIIFYTIWLIYLLSKPGFTKIEDAHLIGWACLILIGIFILIILVDILRHKIHNKYFWIISLILIPFLTPVLYLFQRNRLRHLKENKFRKDG